MNRYTNKTKRRRFAKCFYEQGSEVVKPHLVLTPAQIYGMALQGRPVSNFMLPEHNFDDGVIAEADEITVPLDEKRGVDLNDLFQNHKDLETKSRAYRKTFKQKPKSEEPKS
jgi:hypothetical protein